MPPTVLDAAQDTSVVGSSVSLSFTVSENADKLFVLIAHSELSGFNYVRWDPDGSSAENATEDVANIAPSSNSEVFLYRLDNPTPDTGDVEVSITNTRILAVVAWTMKGLVEGGPTDTAIADNADATPTSAATDLVIGGCSNRNGEPSIKDDGTLLESGLHIDVSYTNTGWAALYYVGANPTIGWNYNADLANIAAVYAARALGNQAFIVG